MSFLARRLDDPELAASFQHASPFPHVVLDGLFEPTALRTLAERFPRAEDVTWWQYDNPLEKKRAFNDLSKLDPSFRRFFDELNSSEFVSQLSKLSGIDGLVADPSLLGGGLHQILPGGKLDVHEDFNVHRELKALRKLNLIVYLNEEWDESYGGHLELWDRDVTCCERKVLPTFNRSVVFRTDCDSNHGHPEPLTCPSDRARNSLALYFYLPADVSSIEYLSTRYKSRPQDPRDPTLDELRARRSKGRLA